MYNTEAKSISTPQAFELPAPAINSNIAVSCYITVRVRASVPLKTHNGALLAAETATYSFAKFISISHT